MLKTCQKCGHPNIAAKGDPQEACPECGTLYSPWLAANPQGAPATAPAAAAPAAATAPTPAPSTESTELPRSKQADEKFCSECGSIIKAKAEICPKCGVRQMAPPSTSPFGSTNANGRNKVVAGVLAIFLGGLGVHKFYLGQGMQGVLYLVFCWTFIPAVIGFIEGLNFLLMSEKTFFERYGT